MNKLVIALSFCSIFVKTLLFAQGLTKISGRILEEESKTPVPYANIIISQTSGTSTNEGGYFELKYQNSNSQNMKLKITSIGYESTQVDLKNDGHERPLIVFLKKKIYSLSEITVNANPISPLDILIKVKQNLDKNYISIPFRREEFVRVKKTDDVGNMLQSVEMYFEENLKNGYSKKNRSREINLIQGRIKAITDDKTIDDKALFWIDYFFLKRHDIHQYPYPYEEPKLYTYSLDKEVFEFESKPVYLLNYVKIEPDNPKNGGWPNALKVTGSMYINESDFAILRIEETIELRDFDVNDKSKQVQKFDDAVKFNKLTSILNFKKKNDGYYLSDSHVKKISNEVLNGKATLVHTYTDLLVTQESAKLSPCNPCNWMFSKAKNEEPFWEAHTIYIDFEK